MGARNSGKYGKYMAPPTLAYCRRLLNTPCISGGLKMRLALVLLLLLAGCVPAASFENANELLSGCELFLGSVRMQGTGFAIQTNDTNAHQCWGYIQAVQALSAVVNEGDKFPITHACLPPTSTGLQLVRVFVSYAQRHPENLHERAGSMALDAFRAAFPCPKR
jgi:hypothetical protein